MENKKEPPGPATEMLVAKEAQVGRESLESALPSALFALWFPFRLHRVLKRGSDHRRATEARDLPGTHNQHQ